MYTVFADYSGDLLDKREIVSTYTTLIISCEKLKDITIKLSSLKDRLQAHGIDTGPQFEFHAQEILKGSRMWRQIEREYRIGVLKEIKKVILAHDIPTVLLLVDKEDAGKNSLEQFGKLIRTSVNKGLNEDTRVRLAKELREVSTKDIKALKGESSVHLIGLLFGLTNGLMSYIGISSKISIIADEQFVRQTDLWDSVFALIKMKWPSMLTPGVFSTWPQDKQPMLLIEDKIVQVKSYNSLGVQLADYVSYVTRLAKLQGVKETCDLSVLESQSFVKIMPGLYVGLANFN